MARRSRRRLFSRRMASGLAFIITRLVGGFVSSVGTDIYHVMKNIIANESGLPLSLPQIIFLLIGIAGLALIVSSRFEPDGRMPGRRKVT